MIHYHGTPVGGDKQGAARFLAGRHALVPFSYPCDLGIVAEACQSFVLDNGAFTHWKAGGDVDVVAYREWVNTIDGHPALDWCLIPDKIDGTEGDNRRLVDAWMDGPSLLTASVPVFHLHESDDWLDYLLVNFKTVALGSSGQWATPGASAWWDRIAEVMAVACDATGRPRARLHGLRMLDPEVFTRMPLASADSTNAAVNCGSLGRFGSYLPPTAAQRAEVIAARIEAHNSAPCWVSQGAQPHFSLGAAA